MHKIVLGYLSDGNFWRGRLYEKPTSTDMNALEFRNPDKLSSHLEVICGGGKGNTYYPSIPNNFDESRLEVIKSTLEERLGCTIEYHTNATINDYWGATEEEERKKQGDIPL